MGRRRKPSWAREVNGILLLDKPSGLSSNQALQRVRRLFKSAKAGHTGSLDPLASGMLPICLGEATKVSSHLLAAAKHYRVSAELGIQTSTGDAEGETVQELAIPKLSDDRVDRVIRAFTGNIEQVPPMYSALKHEGKRLYELARAGQEVERPARPVTIHRIELLALSASGFSLDVSCSKGTYIRSLIEDMAVALGTCGYVTDLRRTAVDPFRQDAMVTLDTLERIAEQDQPDLLDALLLPIDRALEHWPAIALDEGQAQRITQGQPVAWQSEQVEQKWCRLYRHPEEFIGIGQIDDGYVLPRRLIQSRNDPATIVGS